MANGWPFIIHIEFASLYGDKRKQHMNDLKELSKIPQSTSRLIAHGNAERLWSLK